MSSILIEKYGERSRWAPAFRPMYPKHAETPSGANAEGFVTTQAKLILIHEDFSTDEQSAASANWLMETAVNQGGATYEADQGGEIRIIAIGGVVKTEVRAWREEMPYSNLRGSFWRFEVYGEEAGIQLMADWFTPDELADMVNLWLEDLAYEIDPPEPFEEPAPTEEDTAPVDVPLSVRRREALPPWKPLPGIRHVFHSEHAAVYAGSAWD